MTTTLRQDFAEFTQRTGEHPTHIIFGRAARHRVPWQLPTGVVEFDTLTDALLDTKFHCGYGGNEAPNLCAWSPSWVLFYDDYDGSEGLCWVPRNPVEHDPIRPGGGGQ